MDKDEQVGEFLKECVEKGFDLDPDDIRHILDLDFDYVRKQNVERVMKVLKS